MVLYNIFIDRVNFCQHKFKKIVSYLCALQEKGSTMTVLYVTIFYLKSYNDRQMIDFFSIMYLWHPCDRNFIYQTSMIDW